MVLLSMCFNGSYTIDHFILKRYLWINQSWKDALKHSFDLLTLMVVFVYLIYKIYKRNKRMNNNFRGF